jgi:urease accessory protein UreF
MTTTKMTETEALRADLELTRQHLADTVQELARQLNVPRRIKESATSAGHRAVQAAGTAGERAKQMPTTAREHPKAAAAVGGAVALGVGAATWIVRRGG